MLEGFTVEEIEKALKESDQQMKEYLEPLKAQREEGLKQKMQYEMGLPPGDPDLSYLNPKEKQGFWQSFCPKRSAPVAVDDMHQNRLLMESPESTPRLP